MKLPAGEARRSPRGEPRPEPRGISSEPRRGDQQPVGRRLRPEPQRTAVRAARRAAPPDWGAFWTCPESAPPRTAAKPPQSGTENGDATPMSATWRPGSARGTRPLGLKPGDAGGSGDGIDPRRPPPAGASASTGAHGTSPQAATRPRTGAARAARDTNERTPPPDTRSCREPARTPHHPHPRHCTSVTFAASGGARNTTAPQTDSRQAPCGIRGLRSTCRENRAFYARRYTPGAVADAKQTCRENC